MENRLPIWFRQRLPSKEISEFSKILRDRFKLNTVCHNAKCPNISECFSKRHATFLILGNRCTRNCRFCEIEQYSVFDETETVEKVNGLILNEVKDLKAIHKIDERSLAPARDESVERDFQHSQTQDRSFFIDMDEPYRLAQAVNFLNLGYVVITSVTRDDLPDGGAQHFAQTIQLVKENNPDIEIEILIPDFMGSWEALEKVVQEKPDIISHNLETVKRMYPFVRHKANYRRSLNLLKNIKMINPTQITKSSIMLGLGETDKDLEEALFDLRSVHCDMLVLGQYLCPSPGRYPVQKFYSPQEFKSWEKFAYSLGFKNVCAFPLARTSYLMREKNNV